MIPLISDLHRKQANHLALVQQTPLHRDFVSEEAGPRYRRELLKQVMLEVFWYAPSITEAVFVAIGRMPKSHPRLMRKVAEFALVESNHFEMAFRDYVQLGGDGEWARGARISPGSFQLAAVCKRLAEEEDPFAILGGIYVIEGIAPPLNQAAQQMLTRKRDGSTSAVASEFVDAHAKEDIGHTRLMEEVIGQVVLAFPSSGPAIAYGYDCFSLAYPIPIWQEAWVRAQQARE
jgi:hypothetical protein